MEKPHAIFSKGNYVFLISGIVILLAGFILMGLHPGSVPQDVYSFAKITLSPIFIIAGYGLLIMSIFKTSF
jgi:hypothetical protein